MAATHPPDAALRLEALRATVPDGDATRVLLDSVDLSVAGGEVVVVSGPSGAGKSTLLALAGLLRRPETGEVFVEGRATASLSERRRCRTRGRHIGIVYQRANLLPTLTALEQLELVGRINGLRRAATRPRAEELLEQVGLARHRHKLPNHLSGGERQRIGVARALMTEPAILLADEPTASLDPDLSVEIAALLRDQTTVRGLATIVVTHDDAPVAVANRHFRLDGGALLEASAVGS